MGILNDQIAPRIEVYRVGATPMAGPFPIPFPFQDDAEVAVYIDGAKTAAFTVTQVSQFTATGNYVTLTNPVSNVQVSVVSETGEKRILGETFVQAEVSREVDRVYGILQEMRQRGLFTLPLNAAFDILGKRLANVGAPVNPDDAATKAWVEAFISASVASAEASAAVAIAAVASVNAGVAQAEEAAAAALAAEASLIRRAPPWAVGLVLQPGHLTRKDGSTYLVLIGHTATDFTADLGAGRLEMFAQKGDAGAGSGDVQAANNGLEFNAAAFKANLGLTPGTNIMAYSARLAELAALAYANGDMIAFDAGIMKRVPKGAAGQFLKMPGAGNVPAWATFSLALADLPALVAGSTPKVKKAPQIRATGYLGIAQYTFGVAQAGTIRAHGVVSHNANGKFEIVRHRAGAETVMAAWETTAVPTPCSADIAVTYGDQIILRVTNQSNTTSSWTAIEDAQLLTNGGPLLPFGGDAGYYL